MTPFQMIINTKETHSDLCKMPKVGCGKLNPGCKSL